MITYKEQCFFVNRGLGLKDVFLLTILKRATYPITIDQIITYYPILDVKERQLKQLLQNLEDTGMIIKSKSPKGLYFDFTHYNKKRKKRARKLLIKPERFYNNSPVSKMIMCGKVHLSLNINKCNNNYYIKKHKKHYVEDKQKIGVKKDIKSSVYFSPTQFKVIQYVKQVFSRAFPNKNTYVNQQLPQNFDLNKFIAKIKESPFLTKKDNLGLAWCLKNYDAIMANYYKPYTQYPTYTDYNRSQDFKQRTYSEEFFNSLFDNLDDIEV